MTDQNHQPAAPTEVRDIAIRLAGQAQDGIQMIGSLLALLGGRSHRDVMTFMTIPATVSAGHSVFHVRMGCDPVHSVGDEVDVLVAFYQDSYQTHRGWLREGGILLYDSDEVRPDAEGERPVRVGVPFGKLAAEAAGAAGKGKNVFVLGLLARMFQLDAEALRGLIRERLGRKDKAVLDRALRGFEAGLGHASPELVGHERALAPATGGQDRVVMDGNQAMAFGLIAAGIRHGAGYPITPATSIMEGLRAELPKYGGVFLQAEDELAAVSAAIGMSYGGQLAVTSTSGPGLSLKLEALGFATMAEIPLVVVNVQRGGPSTGIPTQVEQSDLMQAIWGSHGDSPRPVLAARSVGDCFDTALEAARIAREYSTPVVLLSDQILATRIEAFPMPGLAACMAGAGLDLTPRPAGFKPYPFDAPTRHAPPGTRMEGGAYPTVTGLEHDETGKPSPAPDIHRRMTARRRDKFLRLRATLPAPEVFGGESGDLLLVGWGSTFGPIREAVIRLRADGLAVSHCHLRHLHPLPPAVEGLLAGFGDVLTVEMNDSGLYGCGQLAYHLRATCGRPGIGSLTKTEGLAFKVREIIDGVRSRLAPPSPSRPA